MTILPKKKVSKEKTDGETSGGHYQLPHSPSSETRVSRRGNSPPRWSATNPREEIIASHDPGGGTFESHDNPTNHNKRRHRSSPHRHVRKHRHERHSERAGHSSGMHASPAGPVPVAPTDLDTDNNTGYNSEDEYIPQAQPENIEELERWFSKTLKEKKGFVINRIGEDGACMFRAIADQVFGDQEMHNCVRQGCVDYMSKNADFFKQYVTEDFNTYINRKRMVHCHGNHIEMQALSELYNRAIEVYQYSVEPINTFCGSYKSENVPIRISYHRNNHYNSIVDPYNPTVGVGLGLPGYQPGLADKNLMGDAIRQSEDVHIEKTMLEDKLRETDWEVTQETIEEQVARESYLQWLRDNEKRAKRQTSPRSASATCSTAGESHSWWEGMGSSSASTESWTLRSPRQTSGPNSTQNSPRREETSADKMSNSPVPGGSSVFPVLAERSFSPPSVTPGTSCTRSPSPPGAVGGAAIFPETTSLMDKLPPTYFGLADWEEGDVLAQVIAQSQQEYLDSLKKNAASTSSNHSNPGCSKDS